MPKRLILAALLALPAIAQTAFRVDPTPVFTVATNVPPGAYTPVLAVAGATVAINATTYTDATAGTACPSNAPINPAGTAGCVATSGATGAFGFWLKTGTYLYTITLPSGQVFGPYPLTVGGSGGGGGGGSSCTGTIVGALLLSDGAGGCVGSTVLAQTGGYLQSNGGFVSNANSWQGFNTNTDGALLRGVNVAQNVAVNAGGYAVFAPVTYNPYNGGTVCHDQWGNVVTQPLPLPGLSAFGAHNVVMWNSTSPSMPSNGSCGAALPIDLDYGLNINTYFFARGGFASDLASYNTFDALVGGMHAMSISLGASRGNGGYINTGNFATDGGHPAPPLTPNDSFNAGAMFYDKTANCQKVFSGSAWGCLAAGSGGNPGGSPGNVQYQIDATTFGGSANNTWDDTNQVLALTAKTATTAGLTMATGLIQGNGVKYNAITAPSGGMQALSFTATKYVQIGSGTADPTTTSGDTLVAGAMYYNTTGTALKVYNGSAFVTVGGGGSGSPGGGDTMVQYNSAGSFAGTSNMEWLGTYLRVIAANAGAAGIAVGTGYVQSDQGFLATSGTANNWNVIQAPTGGMSAKSFTATTYVQTGTSAGAPGMTAGDLPHAGAVNWNSASGCEQVYNGTAWSCLSTGGIPSLNALTGALSITNGGQVGGLTVNPSGSTIALTLPQSLGTASGVTFATATAGTFTSTASGGTSAFQTSGFTWQVNGNGAVTGSGTYQINGTSAGFNAATCTAFNCIQSPSGGMEAKSFSAATYIQPGTSFGPPSVTGLGTPSPDTFHAGAHYWDTSQNQFAMYTGSGGSSGWHFLINTNGAWTGQGVNTAGFGIGGAGYTITNGGGSIIGNGQTWTVNIPSGFTINGSTFTNLIFMGGILVSAS